VNIVDARQAQPFAAAPDRNRFVDEDAKACLL
jgi:hypothetical protein